MRAPTVTVFPELLFLRATDTPDSLAYHVRGERLTWSGLLDGSLRAAATLARHGLGRGGRVAIVLTSSAEFLCAFLGAQILGAVPVALRAKQPAAQLRRRLRELDVALIVGEAAALAAAAPPDDPWPAAIIDAGDLRRDAPMARRDVRLPGPDELSHLQITSGTTGEPRAAMLRHRNVMTSVAIGLRVVAPRPDDVMVGWVPLYHDLGLVRFVFEAIAFGIPTYLIEPSLATVPTWIETISRVRGTITAAPDFAYRLATRLVNTSNVDLSSLRIATSGGEAVRLSTVHAFEDAFSRPGVIRPGYGMAECTLAMSALLSGEPLHVDPSGAVTVGRPFAEAEVRIVRDDGTPCATYERGRIQLRGPLVFAGYFNAPSATADVMLDGDWFETGDDGSFDDEGYLYVRGRRRAMIKRAGASIAPREIEEIADEVPGVRRSAAIGIEPAGTALTEDVLVIIEVQRSASDEERATIREAVASGVRAALGFAPYDVVAVAPNAIPRTSSGKTQYGELRAAWQGYTRGV